MKKVDKAEIIKLRTEERLRPNTIRKRLGISRARVYFVLAEENVPEPTFPELEDPQTFEESDEVLALRFDLSPNQIATARKRLNIKSSPKVSLGRRRRSLVKSLFGENYLPGPNFISFIREQIGRLSSDHRKDLIEGFYLNGTTHSLADNVNNDSDRVYRVLIKKELKEIVSQYNVGGLVNQNILQEKEK